MSNTVFYVRSDSYQKDEKISDVRVGVPGLQIGDFVRVRVAKQKLGLAHKSHLGFVGDNLEIPVNWSTSTHRIIKANKMRVRRTVRYHGGIIAHFYSL